MGISLGLFYNSKVWTKISTVYSLPLGPEEPIGDMVFDQDNGWPAPAWSLGFGKVVQMGSSAGAVEDADLVERRAGQGRCSHSGRVVGNPDVIRKRGSRRYSSDAEIGASDCSHPCR